jgi:DNA (cytosine-5)-methyltransferase 1
MTVTYGSLFAGIGGIDLGFDRAGMECRWQVEMDEHALKVLEKHWKGVHRERDVRECGKHNLEEVEVIAAGFPCQDISYAGRGAGLDGDRSGLFFEVARLVCELRPKVVVLENVVALRTRGLDRVLGTLGEIGYDAEWHCIPAAAFGASHIRDRIFILGYADSTLIKRGCLPCGVQEEESNTDCGGSCGDASEGLVLPNTDSVGQPRQREFIESMYPKENGEEETIIPVPGSIPQVWETEPGMGRVVDGVSPRSHRHRLKQLGNAVCPPVAEFIGRKIMENYFHVKEESQNETGS